MFFNQLKTVLLLATLSGLLMLTGSLIGGAAGLNIALIMAIAMNGIAYFFSDKIVLSMYGAKPLNNTQYAHIYDMVAQLAQTMHIPQPKLWLIETSMANAFATGRNPHNGSIAITTGILNILNDQELRAVLAHELSHIKNRDILVSTIAATIASAIGYIAQMMQHALFWRSVGSRDREGRNPIGMFIIAIFMPIAALLIQLAISRSREFLADETGAHTCEDPLALASALEKLHSHIPQAHVSPQDQGKASTAPLFIVHPFSGNSWTSFFMTHPPMRERIRRLRQIHQKMFSGR